MSWPRTLRDSRQLRRPVLMAVARLLEPLRGGPGFWARAFYDAMPIPYVVAGQQERFVVSTRDRVIGRELFLRSQFDFDKLVTALELLARESRQLPDHLIDVGANIGSITIPAVSRGLVASATAIEPHPENLRLLRANVALNSVDARVDIIGMAVGDQAGVTLHLEESDSNSGNHSIGERGVPIHSTRLDDLGLPFKRSLLWMDIEGYEGHALRGATQLLKHGVPVVAEFNPRFLTRCDGREAFREAIGERTIFDLAAPAAPTTLSSLEARLADSYTDILAI